HDRQQVENLLPVATHEIQRSLRLETIEFVVARHQRIEFYQQCPAYTEVRNDAPKRGRRQKSVIMLTMQTAVVNKPALNHWIIYDSLLNSIKGKQ
ncbi:MAG: hypothetical protein ACRCUF_14185, partial [Aeromonas sobria]